ncbi:MAG: twin-arginine translocation signal domain-containing protein, partial [Bacteroidales bacterium]|nr:twin-arginine translocation signal domain-containing protein [Bacteroidales bacterium]
MNEDISRRSFLKKGTAMAAGLAVAPGIIIAGEAPKDNKKKKKVAPIDKLNILGVGIGGRGSADLREMETENIIGLCDVDWKYAAHVFDRYPNAKRYNDYRVMFDEMLDKADA